MEKNNDDVSQTSASSFMSVPSDKQHETEINRNKWTLLQLKLFLQTDFLDLVE